MATLSKTETRTLANFLPGEPPVDGMTQLMINFVDNMIIYRGNKLQAYKHSGYKASNANVCGVEGWKLCKNIKVLRLLAWRLEQIRKAHQIDVRQERVVKELNRLAFSSLGDVCSWDEDGVVTVKTLDDLTDDAVAAIKKIKCTKSTRTDKEGNATEIVVLEIEQHDKKGPLELLARASKLIDKGGASLPVTINMNFGPQSKTQSKREKEVNPRS